MNKLLDEELQPDTGSKKEKKKSKSHKPKEILLIDRTLEGIATYMQARPCRNIIVLSGAGVSTRSGLPDMRTPGSGLYFTQKKNSLPYIHALFESKYFKRDPRTLFRMLNQVLDIDFKPTLAHYFITLIQRKNMLLKNYTQNSDDLESIAGLPKENLGQIYGTFNEFSCRKCDLDVTTAWVKDQLERDIVPQCDCGETIKPKMYLYGERLPKYFCHRMAEDFKICDMLIVMGTSLSDEPVASMPFLVSKTCPRLVINASELSKSLDFDFSDPKSRDVMFLGDCDEGCLELAEYLGWSTDLRQLIDDAMNMNV